MHLTIRTSLAMRTLMFCATNPGRIVRRAEIAEACGASENHLAQVIYLLAQNGFLRTIRGRAGGLTLARSPETITVGEVFRRFEKVLPFSDCIGHEEGKCPLAGACRLTCILSNALEQFYETLDGSTISDLVSGNSALQARLQLPIAC